MRSFLIILTTAVVIGPFFFVAGGYFTGRRVIRDASYGQLLWLTSIDRELHAGRYDRARDLSRSASDMTLQFLGMLEDDPKLRTSMLMTAMGGFRMDELNDEVATRAKLHFLPISEKMSEESKRFLSKVVEVTIPPSTCSNPKTE